MNCPKCHKSIAENTVICPHCRKVLAIKCPNCHSLNESSICQKCGYILLTKCSKCGKIVPANISKCKCGFPVKTSIGYNECENDEFASLTISFGSLKNIRKQINSKEMFTKFFCRLRNLLTANFANIDGKIITYNDQFVINMNKELSFVTSANKAVRLAIKIANSFTELNLKTFEEFKTALNLKIAIVKKTSDTLLEKTDIDTNIKMLTSKKNEKKYIKGMQIVIDQYVCDSVMKDFKTDSLYSLERDGKTFMYYEIVLDSYIAPPQENISDIQIAPPKKKITKPQIFDTENTNGFNVFDIKAKCKFKQINADSFFDKFELNKVTSIKNDTNVELKISDFADYFEKKGIKVVHIVCSEELTFKPWGVLQELFKEYYNISQHKDLISPEFKVKRFSSITNLIKEIPRKASSTEDARFAYLEDFTSFLSSIKKCIVIIEGFENIDDTSLQAFSLYFDKFKKINSQFVFISDKKTSVHSMLKGLLRTPFYTEYTLQKSGIDSFVGNIKEDATDFINSLYFEKIKEQFDGSNLYFEHAIRYLEEKNAIIKFENSFLINDNNVILPLNLQDLLKARLKHLSKNQEASSILAYSTYLGARLDYKLLEKLGIRNIDKNVELLVNSGFGYSKDDVFYVNNFNLIKPVIQNSIKKNVNEFLSKNILANIGKGLDNTLTLLTMGKLGLYKEEYLLLWKNSQIAMATGDYDAYLKNCLGFLSLTEHIENNIAQEDIENNKKEVYENILKSLYNYSPEKIYEIAEILLTDSVNKNDDNKIIKLSNMMLQGALISANYTNALKLINNIYSRMQHPSLLADGCVNTKFLLLSLVNIEILYNVGDFEQCAKLAKDLLSIIQPSIIEKIKPPSFSTSFFVEHLMETFRLAGFAKLLMMDEDLEYFLDAINKSLDAELPDRTCILALKDFLNGKEYVPSNVEYETAFAKIIYLIMQEYSKHKSDYKTFAQNIYQAKLLAADIHQAQLEMFCELLIAHSYANMGITQKAETIYSDILKKSEKASIFNIIVLSKYFIARLYIREKRQEESLQIINETLELIQKYNNQAKIFYVIFEKLLIEFAKAEEIDSIDVESEMQKLILITNSKNLARLL